jgi:hypothetical protein
VGIDKKALYEMYFLTFAASETGQGVLADLSQTYTEVLSFDSDPLRMAFNEGCRNVVLEIKRFIELHQNPVEEE